MCHGARLGNKRDAHRGLVGRSDGRNHLKDVDVDGMTILNGTYRSRVMRHGLDDVGQNKDSRSTAIPR